MVKFILTFSKTLEVIAKICSVGWHNTFSTHTTYLRSRYNSIVVQDIKKCYITNIKVANFNF